jgi:fructose-1,6-bisphosphatase/sedoheptulose 1,7-bisphosphatase-like protein
VVNRQRVNEIRVIGRATQGVRVMALDDGDVLTDVACVIPEEENGADGIDDGDAIIPGGVLDDIAADELTTAGGVAGEEFVDETELPADE